MSKLKSLYPLALYVLALALRLIALNHFAANDPNFYNLPEGTDQRGYMQMAQGVLDGAWPDSAFYFQPLYPFILAGLQWIVGPDLFNIRAAQAALGSLGVLLCFNFAERLVNRRAAWIAGTLYAIYPVFIFYDITPLTAGPAVLFSTAILSAYHQLAESRQWRWVPAAAILSGLGAGVHPLLLAFAPVGAVWVVWKQFRRGLPLAIGLAVAVTAAISPYSLWNYKFLHRWTLISTSGPVNFYVGNNRAAAGIGESNLAWEATVILNRRGRTDYMAAALDDIRSDPGRWLQLVGRKLALAWANAEVANNVTYYEERDYSPLLASIPLGFSAVAALALAGAYYQRRQSSSWMLLAGAFALGAAMCIGAVLSRLRAPMVPPLIILAGAALDYIAAAPRRPRAWLIPLLAGAALVWGVDRLTGFLPRPLLVSSIPAGYHSIGSVNGAAAFVPDSLPKMEPGIPYWIPVYWQAAGPMDRDYKTLIQLIDANGQKRAQGDHVAGETGFPYYPASQWKQGDIIKDQFLIIPPDDLPAPFSAAIWIGLYDPDRNNERLPAALPGGSPSDALSTQLIAVTRGEAAAPPDDAAAVNAQIGAATLTAYAIRGGMLTLYWQAGGPMPADGVIFVHLFDSNGKFVAGADSRPLNGLYSTLVWQEGEGIVDDHALPDAPPGTYTIKIGMYDAASHNRMTVVAANGETMPDGVLTLGTAEIP